MSLVSSTHQKQSVKCVTDATVCRHVWVSCHKLIKTSVMCNDAYSPLLDALICSFFLLSMLTFRREQQLPIISKGNQQLYMYHITYNKTGPVSIILCNKIVHDPIVKNNNSTSEYNLNPVKILNESASATINCICII